MEKHAFPKGSKLDFERRTPYCWSKTRFARFYSEANFICTNMKNLWQIHPKIDARLMKKRGKVHAGQSNATNMKNIWKLSSKRKWKSKKMWKNRAKQRHEKQCGNLVSLKASIRTETGRVQAICRPGPPGAWAQYINRSARCLLAPHVRVRWWVGVLELCL
jgi:hypothetical protein